MTLEECVWVRTGLEAGTAGGVCVPSLSANGRALVARLGRRVAVASADLLSRVCSFLLANTGTFLLCTGCETREGGQDFAEISRTG